MKIYDSLSQKEKQINNKVNIYCCGPTVYNYIHIGNARPSIMMDVLVRFLKYKNIEVNYIQNITDIDDKIITKAIQKNKKEWEISKKYLDAYIGDLETLNVLKPNNLILISEEIEGMIDFIETLILKGNAYEVDGDIYFDINSLKSEYGKLSQKNIDDLISGERVAVDKKKRNPLDFSLWKKTNEGIQWDSKFGKGRPGWHTECVYLIDKYFNEEEIDIHSGGIDLKFPHHENERIQFIAKNGNEMAKIWMHNGHLTINDSKMSKSIGNVILVSDFIKENNKNLLRYIFLTSKYTQPLNLNENIILQGNKFFNKLSNLNKKVKQFQISNNKTFYSNTILEEYVIKKFEENMENNLSTSMVITLIEEIIKNINNSVENENAEMIEKLSNSLKVILNTLGFTNEIFDFGITELEKKTFINWKQKVNEKNFDESDKLRKELIDMGIL